MNKIFKRILTALLSIVLTIAMVPTSAVPAFAAAGSPLILVSPADATYSKAAPARFMVSALSPDGGNLTYAWYRSKAYTAPVDGANGTGKSSITDPANREGGLLGNQSVLFTTTPTYSDTANYYYYYYWCEVTNNKGGDVSTPSISQLALVKVVNRTLEGHIINGDFEYWRSHTTAAPVDTGTYRTMGGTDPHGNTFVAFMPSWLDGGGNGRLGTATGTDGRYYTSDTGWSLPDDAWYDPLNGWRSTQAPYSGVLYSTFDVCTHVGMGLDGAVKNPAPTGDDYYNIELGASSPSSAYQDVATVPGKIYEWSVNHAADNQGGGRNTQRIAVVIGSSINSESDYLPGVTKRWISDVFPYGQSNTNYFDDIVANLAGGVNNIASLTDGEYTTLYNGHMYYIAVGYAPELKTWYKHSGVYTIPRGQGTTVFGFAYITPRNRSNGNVLDDVVFASGTDLQQETELAYSGETKLEVETESGFAYALLELRGSSLSDVSPLNALNNGGAVSPDGDKWFRHSNITFANGGTLTFTDLVPGKSYRVIGIPETAINPALDTNILPRDVLDEGYYYDTKIQATAGAGSGGGLSSVSMRIETDNTVTLTLANTNINTQYGILPNMTVNGGDAPNTAEASAVKRWTTGTGGELPFTGLSPSTTYWIVARPLNYDEITYADAAYDNSKTPAELAAMKAVTPSSATADVIPSQLVRDESGGDITVSGTLAGQTYAAADVATGLFAGAEQTGTGTAAPLTFSGLDATKAYQVVTKATAGGSYLEGVRVYPYAPELAIDFAAERVVLAGNNGVVPSTVTYEFTAGGSHIATGNSYINLTETQTASGDTLTYRLSDAAGYSGKYLYPLRNLTIPTRPLAPVNTDFTFDFENERINAVSALQYRIGNTVQNLAAGANAGFAAFNWSGAERSVDLRLPATGNAFASQYTTTAAIPARPAAPDIMAMKSGQALTLNNLKNGVGYEWYKNSETSTWHEFTSSSTSELIDTGYQDGDTYTVRLKSTTTAPRSYSVTVAPEPLFVAGVNFGTYTFGNNAGSVFLMLRNNESSGEIAITNISVTGAFTLNTNAPATIAAGGYTNSTYTITPTANLGAGTYSGEITVAYTHSGKPYTTKANVNLAVDRADWDMSAVTGEIKALPPFGFTVFANNMPSGSIPEFRLDGTDAWEAGDGQAMTYNGLTPATTYVVYVRARGDGNHNVSAPRELVTVHTIHGTPVAANIISVDYINETMQFKSGAVPTDYEATIGGLPIANGGSLTAWAEMDDFTISLRHKASGAGDIYGASLPDTLTVTGKAAAPTGVTTEYASSGSTADGAIERSGAFQYTAAGGAWTNAPTAVNTARVPAGTYWVRIPAAADVFASKAAQVTVDNYEELEGTVNANYSAVTVEGYKDAASPGNLLYSFTKRVLRNAQLVIPQSELPAIAPEWKLKASSIDDLTLTPTLANVTVKLLYETGVTKVTVYAKKFGTAENVIAPIEIPGVEIGRNWQYPSPSIPGYQLVNGLGANIVSSPGALSPVAANAELTFWYKPSEGNQTIIYYDDDAGAEIGRTAVTVRVNESKSFPIPDIAYYTKVTTTEITRAWDGGAAPADITYHYTRQKATVTLRAFNTSTGLQIGGDLVTGNRRAGELFSLTTSLAALDTQVAALNSHTVLTNYTRLTGPVNWFVDANPANNIINVYYQPKIHAYVTVNIRVSGTETLLQSYQIPSAVNEVVRLTPASITIAGYAYDNGNTNNKLSVTVSGNAANDTLTMYMTDMRRTVTVKYLGVAMSPDVRKVISGDNFYLNVPYIAGYALKSYQIGTAAAIMADSVPSPFISGIAADVNVTLTYQSADEAVNANYVTVTVKGYKDSSASEGNLLYSYTKRVNKGSTQVSVVPESELPKLAPNWKLKSGQSSNGNITPDADKTVNFVYETGVTSVTVETRAFGDPGGSPLITPVVIQNVEIGGSFSYSAPSVPSYQAVDGTTGLNLTGQLTLSPVPAQNAKLTFYYKPAQGNLTVICKDEKDKEIYRTAMPVATNAPAKPVAVPHIDHHTTTAAAVNVAWDGTASGWQGTTDPGTAEVVYKYTRDRVTVTLHGKNAGNGVAIDAANLTVTVYARVNEMLDVTAALAALDAKVGDPLGAGGANITAVRMSTYTTVYVGANIVTFDVLYREAKINAMLVKVVAAGAVPEQVLYSYFIEGLTDGETVTVNPDTISFEGYTVVPGSYTGKVDNYNLSKNVITVPMTDERHTVSVHEVIRNVSAGTDTAAKTTVEKYAYTQGRFIPTPYRPGYSAIEYRIGGSGLFTPLGTSEGVTLGAGNADYEVTFRYVTLAEAVKTADVTIYAKLYSNPTRDIVTAITSNRRVGEPFSYIAPAIEGYVLVHDNGTLWTETDRTKSLASVSETVSANTLTFYYKPEYTMQTVNLIDDRTNAVFASYGVRVNVDTPTVIPASLSLAPTAPTDFTAYYEGTSLSVQQSVTWNGSGTLPEIGYRFTRKTVALTLRAYDSIKGTPVPGAADVALTVRVGESYDFSGSLNALTANVNGVLVLGDTAERLENSALATVAFAPLEVRVFYTLTSSVEEVIVGGKSVITIVGRARDAAGAVLYSYLKAVPKSAVSAQVVLPSDVFDLSPAWTLIGGQEGKMSFAPTDDLYTVEFYYRAQGFEIFASAGSGGRISPSGTAVVTQGTAQVYTVTADPGYHIVAVLVDGVDVFALSGNIFTYTFDNTIAGNHTIFAAFADDAVTPLPTYSITAYAAATGGRISPNGIIAVVQGVPQTYTVTADAEHHIVSVLVDGADVYALSGNIFTYTFDNAVAGNHTIFAAFAEDKAPTEPTDPTEPATATITASAGAGGTISHPGANAVTLGGSITFNITANSGYRINAVLVDSVNVGAVSSYTFNNVTTNHSITANFVASGGGGGFGGGGSGSGAGSSAGQTTKPGITTDGNGTGAAGTTPSAIEKPWFRDVPQTAWFYGDVRFVTDKGLFKGTDEFMFSPNIPTTRGMLVTVLYRLAGEPNVTGSPPFSDVNGGSYYANAVAWANAKGIVYGVGGNRFEPDRSITRQELAVIILRYTEFARMSLERVREGEIFADARSIGDWALSAVDELYRAGIVNGKDRNMFDPMGEATRAEASAILRRLIGIAK